MAQMKYFYELTISSSPHAHSPVTTQTIMRDVLIALIPAMLGSVYFFGFRALTVTAVVRNAGGAAADDVEVACYADLVRPHRKLASPRVSLRAAGKSALFGKDHRTRSFRLDPTAIDGTTINFRGASFELDVALQEADGQGDLDSLLTGYWANRYLSGRRVAM